MTNIIVSIVALAVSLSIDALGTGISYGLRQIKIPAVSKLVICVFSMAYSGSALLLGGTLGAAMPRLVSRIIGIGVLGLMGMWIIIRSLMRKENQSDVSMEIQSEPSTLFQLAIKSLGITIQVIKNPSKSDIDKSGIIDAKESVLLGLALSVDAIGAGIGSALAGFSSIYIPLSVGLFQWLFLFVGTLIGTRLFMRVSSHKKLLEILPGLLMIFLAALRF